MQDIDLALLKVAEEASEVAKEAAALSQECMKAVRFGPFSAHPDQPDTVNMSRILHQFSRVCEEYKDLEVATMILSSATSSMFNLDDHDFLAMGIPQLDWDWSNLSKDRLASIVRRVEKYRMYLPSIKERGDSYAAAADRINIFLSLTLTKARQHLGDA